LNDTEADSGAGKAIAVAGHLPEFAMTRRCAGSDLACSSDFRGESRIIEKKRAAGWSSASAFPNRPVFPSTLKREPNARDGRTRHRARPDPREQSGRLFEAEWRKNLLAAALERVKRIQLKQFQMFDLNVLTNGRSADVARSFGVSSQLVCDETSPRGRLKKGDETTGARNGDVVPLKRLKR